MNKKTTLLLLGLFAVACNAKSANAFSSPFSIDNTQFTVNPGNLGLNNADANSTINTTANPNGFGGQFDATDGNTFLLLGASDVGSGINAGGNAAMNNSDVEAVSTSFALDADNISAGKINFQFDYSFQGTDSQSDDLFIDLRPVGQTVGTELVAQTTYGGGFFDQEVDISNFSEGDYELAVFLNEANRDSRNSAAGVDNIFISEVAPPPATPVPFGAAPNTGIFILGSLYAGSSYLKRRKMSS